MCFVGDDGNGDVRHRKAADPTYDVVETPSYSPGYANTAFPATDPNEVSPSFCKWTPDFQ